MTGEEFVTEPALWRSVARGAVLGLAIGGVLELINHFGDTQASVVPLIGMPVVCLVLLQVFRASIAEPPPPELADQSSASMPEYFLRLRQLERRLERACHDASDYEWTVRPMLAQLAAERLHFKHGVSVHRESARAREVLGEQLWQIMTIAPEGSDRPVTPSRLHELVQAISRI
jgi:hypothetical protein